MAIIKFANGTQVNFNGNPTPQDVEEVANKIGINQQMATSKTATQTPTQPGFLQNLSRGIASPFVKAGELLSQGGQAFGSVLKAGGQSLAGNQKGAQETIKNAATKITTERAKPIQLFGGDINRIETPKQALGTAIELGAWFVPVGAAGQTAKTLTTGAKILKGIGQGAKIGVETGALMGAGQALQEDKNMIGGAIKGGLGGLVLGGVFGGAGAGISKLLQPVKTDLANYIGKALKPSFAGKTAEITSGKYYDDAIKAFETIVDNKSSIKLTDEAGTIVNKLPENRTELLQAIQDVKTSVFKKYNELAVSAGESGAKFNPNPIIADLTKVVDDVSYNPQIRKYAESMVSEMQELSGQTPEVVQSRIRDLNDSLGGFFAGRVDKAKARLDASVASKLNQQLDQLITNTTGNAYRPLRMEYSALKSIEKDVARQVAIELRKNQKGLLDFTDVFTGGDILAGVIDPTSLVRGLGGRGIKEVYKYLNDPNRYVKKIFNVIEKQKAKESKIIKPSIPKLNYNTKLLPAPKGNPSVYGTPLITPIPEKAMLPREINTPQIKKTVKTMYTKAPQTKAEIDSYAGNIANEFGGFVTETPLKKEDKVLYNIRNKYKGDTSRVTDIARNTIVAESNLISIYNKMLKDGSAVGKIIDHESDPLGYSGFNVRKTSSNGMQGEIQINTPDMIYAKEGREQAIKLLGKDVYNKMDAKYESSGGLGHKYYDEYVDAIYNGDISGADSIANISKNYYSGFKKGV